MKIRSFYQKHCGHALMMIMDMVGHGGKELWTWWWRWVTNKCLPGRWQTCRRGPRELRSTGGRGRTRSPWSWWSWCWGWRGCRDAVSREILTLFCWFVRKKTIHSKFSNKCFCKERPALILSQTNCRPFSLSLLPSSSSVFVNNKK